MAWSWRGNIQRFLKITRTYVYDSCTVLEEFVHNALYVGGLELVREFAANAVEYGTKLN